MWPSTSRWTRRGSPVWICVATAVTIPNANEENARSPRIRTRRRRRSLRILRRRPPLGAFLGLGPSKQESLGGRRVLDGDEGHLRRQIDASVLLHGQQHRGAVGDGARERERGDITAAVECAGRLRAAALGHPGLIGLAVRRRIEAGEDE